MPYSTGGVTAWLALDDTPSSYTASKAIKVNSAGNALEFYDAATALAGIDDDSSSNSNQIHIEDDEVVINETGMATLDFRAESDNQTHMLFVDASTDRLGVQQSTPETTMQMN